jgi:transposase
VSVKPSFVRFLDDGRIWPGKECRPARHAIGRKAGLFAGSDRGGERAAAVFTLIQIAKLHGIDP